MIISQRSSEKGFTLLELMIAMIVIGFTITVFMSYQIFMIDSHVKRKTHHDFEVIADAISIYAQKHMRVPCPAEPNENYGFERGSGSDGSFFGECDQSIKERNGVVPYKALGLKRETVVDFFGNYYSYHVSLSSIEKPTISSKRLVNNWCMSPPHWFSNGQYNSLEKAAFCCGTWNNEKSISETDIELHDYFGLIKTLTRKNLEAGGKDGQGGHNIEYRNFSMPPASFDDLKGSKIPFFDNKISTILPSFPIYVLVGHGKNGYGAYQVGVDSKNSHSGSSLIEVENSDADNVFIISNTQNKKQKFSDDIVFWQTAPQIISRLEGGTCSRP